MRTHARMSLFAFSGLAAAALAGCSAVDGLTESASDLVDSASDAVTSALVQQFEVGECLDSDGEVTGDGTEVGEIPVVDCTEAHDAEVFFVAESEAAEFEQAGVSGEAEKYCEENFEAYVGIDYNSSSLYYTSLYPSQETWDVGDRQLVCLLAGEEDATESYKGSGV